jgi:hypothetical protein
MGAPGVILEGNWSNTLNHHILGWEGSGAHTDDEVPCHEKAIHTDLGNTSGHSSGSP